MKNADTEIRRITAIRAAAARPGYAAWSTGPRTARGKRKLAANATKHGGASMAFKLAVAYADAVLVQLGCIAEIRAASADCHK